MAYNEIDVSGYNVAELQSLIKEKSIPDHAVLDAESSYDDVLIITLCWKENDK